MDFATRKAWADRFLDQQYQILNSCINKLDFNKVKHRGVQFAPAPEYDDQNLETDVIMFGALRIALRVRNGQSSIYGDIALRSHKPSGCATEVHKLKQGFGDYYLYCWTTDGILVTEWILFDLDAFREVMDSCWANTIYMPDGSAFNTYQISRMIERGCCVDEFLNVLV